VQVLRAYAAERAPSALAAELGKGASVVAQLIPEVADALPDLPALPVLEPELARFQFFDAVSTLLRAASRATPVVVVVDDLHWADHSSLVLLQFLTRELGAARLLLIGTYRDIEGNRRHPLNDTPAEVVREPVTTRLVLQGLGQAEVARCIFEVTGAEPAGDLVAVVHDRTEGNPFFVMEVVRLLAAEGRLEDHQRLAGAIPDGIRQVIGRRLNRLSDAINEILTVAAVQGRDFDLDVLCRVAGVSAGEALGSLEGAVDAHLVATAGRTPSRHRFVHALVRETLYDELPIGRRQSLHQLMGEALVELRASDLDAHLAELAHHFFQAALPGQAAPAVEYCTRAADRAYVLLAYHEAVGRYQRALQALDLQVPSEHARRAELLLALGRAQTAAADPATARATAVPSGIRGHRQRPLEQAEQLAQESLMLGQQAQHQGVLAAFLVTMATIRFAQGRLGELASVFEEAIERPPALPAWRATLAVALCQADRIDDARGQFERLAVDDFAGLPRDFTWMSGLAALAWTCASLNDRQRAPILYDLLAPFGPDNVRISRLGVGCLGPVTHYLGLLAATMSRWEDAIRHFKAAIELSSCLGAPAFLANSRLQYARLLRSRGRPEDDRAAENHFTQAHSSADSLGIRLHLDDERQSMSRTGRKWVARLQITAPEAAGCCPAKYRISLKVGSAPLPAGHLGVDRSVQDLFSLWCSTTCTGRPNRCCSCCGRSYGRRWPKATARACWCWPPTATPSLAATMPWPV
jgi:tetratricopeptide (TPR) repeat protein